MECKVLLLFFINTYIFLIRNNTILLLLLLLHRNLAEELVKEGLATVMNNPRDDQMSQCFDDLKKAEEIAKQSHKGLYSKSSPPKQRITDCSSAAVSKIIFVIIN